MGERKIGIVCAALLAALLAIPAQAQPADAPWSFEGLRPAYRSSDGQFTMAVRARLQIDGASFDSGTAPLAHPKSGALVRRAYLGIEGDAYRRFHYEFRMDFASAHLTLDEPIVNLARLSYDFGGPASHIRVNAGLIKPIFTLDDATSSASLLFLERSDVINVATAGYGGGGGRPGAELTFEEPGIIHAGDNLVVSAAFTGRSADGGNRGTHILGRLAYRLWSDDFSSLQIGGSAARILDTQNTHALVLEDAPEIRVDETALVGTGPMPARGGTLWGLESAATIGNFYFAGEYYGFGSEGVGAAPHFSGWYLQGSWILTGQTRLYLPDAPNNNFATFANPRVTAPFSASRHDWGIWEIAARYSTLNLNWREGAAGTVCGVCVRGGEQKIWTFGLNWYVSDNVRMLFDYMRVDVERLNSLGQQAGRRFDVVATRLQFAN